LCLITLNSYAQSNNQAAISGADAAVKAENYFNKAIGQQSRLYNGAAYAGYYSNIEGSAYFQEIGDFSNGTVWYDGFRYDNIPLKYDIFKDVMVTILNDNSSLFSLVSEKVSAVKFNNHQFVYLTIQPEEETTNLKSGFYALAYDGKLKVLVRSTKVTREIIDVVAKQVFTSRTSYFLLKDNVYYQVSSESSFMEVLKDQKSSLKKYLKENKIKFNKDPEKAMIVLANYYDKLTN